MAAVYSTQFFGFRAAAGIPFIYTVPAGYVAVLRDLDIVTIGATVSGTFTLGTNQPVLIYQKTWATGDNVWQQWTGRQVVPAGIDIQVEASARDHYCSLSGYLLSA